MSLETFLHSLHYDTKKAGPLDWEVDWADKPFAYKLYRDLPAVPLSPEVPLTLERRDTPGKPGLREIGHFLWYVYGLTQWNQSVFPMDSVDGQSVGLMQSFRRFVPSGGALYPNELYVYLKLEDLPAGVYHYDVAHHRLVLLREGDFDSYLGRSLGNRCDVPACFGAVLVSTRFWKNFFKYHNFAYRLQGLDAGVLIGQLLETAKRFRFATCVYFRFLDRAVNHLLGLLERDESVYAVIPLSADPETAWFNGGPHGDGTVSAGVLCRELPDVRHRYDIGSRTVKDYPMLIRMNEACLMESLQPFRRVEGTRLAHSGRLFVLPRVKRLSYDLSDVCRERYSPDMDFVLDKVSLTQLAALLQEATASIPYRNDLDGANGKPSEPRVSLYVCLYGVEGIPDGAYHYDSAAHALQQVRPGDHRGYLQEAMSLHNVNLFQVPLCFHVAGERDHLVTPLGYRGYRIQQMEAGMLVQRLLIAAFAFRLGGHPLLGYDVNLCDELYGMTPWGKTNLIQVPVGPYRHRAKLTGGLHS